ncbi:hypothetical protein AURDEDRAFT_164293 [Auricularia subglabra TFB-10046 SS5]|nr:hypothetical protein AURDEDRAFT_164293 [Auricularia subglabra TFB-10046 SS5]
MHPEPDWTQIQNGTLHTSDLAKDWYLLLSFQGSAVYVFFTLFSGAATILQFGVDGSPLTDGGFSHIPSTTVQNGYYMYRMPVFSQENLSAGIMHTISVSNLGPPNGTGTDPVYALFDYTLYTTEVDDDQPAGDSTAPAESTPGPAPAKGTPHPAHTSGTPSPAPPSPGRPRHAAGVIAAAASVVGGILVVASAAWYLRRRRKQRHAASPSSTAAWTDNSSQLEPFPRPGKAILDALSASDEKGRPRPAAKISFEKAPLRPSSAAPELALEVPSSSGTAAVALRAAEGDAAAELRAQLEMVLEENEILRQAGPPPDYVGKRSVAARGVGQDGLDCTIKGSQARLDQKQTRSGDLKQDEAASIARSSMARNAEDQNEIDDEREKRGASQRRDVDSETRT